MSWLNKLSQLASVQLKKSIHTQSNRTIYYLVGDTYNLHKTTPLGHAGLGFQYWKEKRMWWMYAERMNLNIATQLANKGVDVSDYSEQIESTAPAPAPAATSSADTPTVPSMPSSAPPTTPDNLTDKSWDFENKWDEKKRLSEKAGFPVKKIYEQDITIEFEGKPITTHAVLSRSPKPGKSQYGGSVAMGWKGFPRYYVDVSIKETGVSLGKFTIPINKETQERKWSAINESAEVIPWIETKIKEIYTNPQTKGYSHLRVALQRQGRDPEFTQFLQDHQAYGKKQSKIMKSVQLDDPTYGGTFPVSFHASHDGETWYGETALSHPMAPRPETLFYLDMPFEVQNIEQFNQWLDQAIAQPENQKRANETLLKYLKSFPYLEEEQNVAQESMKEILPIIRSKSMDVMFFRNKLLQNGYIRPSKRQAQAGPGMVPQESIKMVIDAKKIVDDIYRYGKHANNPNFFYAVVAYYMHRLKSGNIGFMPIMLMDAVRHLKDVLKRFGEDIDFKDLDDYLESVGRHLLQSLFDVRNARTAWDQWDQFYSGNWGQGSGGSPAKNEYARTADLNEFITFATIYGISPEQAKASPKSTFRQLALKLHPDTSSNPDKEQAAADFISLKEIWDRIPDSLKQAYTNWWCRVVYGSSKLS
jgi:hypothetical protein